MKFVVVPFLFIAGGSLANSIPVVDMEKVVNKTESVIAPSPINDFFMRLRPYEGSYVYFDYGRGNDLDGHLDVQYSFRYLFTQPHTFNAEDEDYEVSFTFSGEFDFYMLSRDSGPVIGRRYNPGIMYQHLAAKKSGLIVYNFSFEHESNGQVVDTPNTLFSLQRDFKNRYQERYPNLDDSYYLDMATDSVSRSTEIFAAIGGVYRINVDDTEWFACNNSISCFEIYFKFRDSLGDVEDDVFWDGQSTNAHLIEHQGSQLSLYSGFNNNIQSLTLIYRTGQIFGGNPGQKNTWDINYTHNLKISDNFYLPVILSYHYGYLEELSNYSEKTSYFSMGLFFHL